MSIMSKSIVQNVFYYNFSAPLQQQQAQKLQQQKGDPPLADTEQFDMWMSTGEVCSMGVEEVAGVLRVDVRNGLGWHEAEQRRALTGLNELSVLQEDPTWKKYIEQVRVVKCG